MFWLSYLWKHESWWGFLRRRSIIIPSALAVILVGLIWLLAFLAPVSPAQSFTLRYSIYFGPNWIVSPAWLIALPAIASIIVTIDLFLAYIVGRGTVIMAHIWVWTAVAVAAGFMWLEWLLVGFNS